MDTDEPIYLPGPWSHGCLCCRPQPVKHTEPHSSSACKRVCKSEKRKRIFCLPPLWIIGHLLTVKLEAEVLVVHVNTFSKGFIKGQKRRKTSGQLLTSWWVSQLCVLASSFFSHIWVLDHDWREIMQLARVKPLQLKNIEILIASLLSGRCDNEGKLAH